MHINIQTMSSNIQWYCTVQNWLFSRFEKTTCMATTWQFLNKLSLVHLEEPDWQVVFSTNQNTPPHLSLAPCITLHVLAIFLFVQIFLQNSVSVLRQLDNTAVYFYSSFAFPCRLTSPKYCMTHKNIQPYYTLNKCLIKYMHAWQWNIWVLL